VFYFHEFLNRVGLDPSGIRLLRHDNRGLAAWRRGTDAFGCFVSFQRRNPSPYAGVRLACHFIAGPTLAGGDASALFVGTTRILDEWDWDGQRLPVIQDQQILQSEQGNQDLKAFDLEWVDNGQDYLERVLVRWGPPSSTRAWSQWASRRQKHILELRMDPREPPFPGFSAFVIRISSLILCPMAWQSALGSVRGIYLLVADTGEQYVGSASGQDGFMGRWTNYAANGHGGNVLLLKSGHRDCSVSILEVASPDMSQADIVARETFWKHKLGVRAHGLNGN
jgi:hypothetical protein